MSENLYKKLASKTPVDAKFDHSKNSNTRGKPEYQDPEISDGREDTTRNIIIKETRKRNQRYYDMRTSGLSRESSDRSSESPRSRRKEHPGIVSTLIDDRHPGKRKQHNRKVEQKSRTKNYDEDVRYRPTTNRDFPTSDLDEDFLSSGEGNAASLPPLQRLTVRYVNPSISGKSSNSSGSKGTGSDYGSLPRNFERLRVEGRLDTECIDTDATVHDRKLHDDELGVTPASEPETSFSRRTHRNGYLARSLEDIVGVQSDSEYSRAYTRKSRPRSLFERDSEITNEIPFKRDSEKTNEIQNKNLNVETSWNPTEKAPNSPILRRIDKFKRPSVSSSSSASSVGLKTNSRETSEGETGGHPTTQRFVPENF